MILDLRGISNKITVKRIKTEKNPWDINRVFDATDYSSIFRGTVTSKKTEPKALRNPIDGSFLVIASNLNYAQEILDIAQRKGLTVSGDGSARSTGRNIEEILPNEILTFGTSKRFDVNFISRPSYAKKNNLVPVYDVVKDYRKVIEAINEMADEKKTLQRSRDGYIKALEYKGKLLYRELKSPNAVKELKAEPKKAEIPATKKLNEVGSFYNYVRIGDVLIPKACSTTAYIRIV
jgi:hypothetical protein